MLLLLLACKPDPCTVPPSSYVPPHEGWTPITEEEHRLSQSDLSWSSPDGAVVDPNASDCDTSPCLTIGGPGEAVAEMPLNRSSPYTLSFLLSGGGATISMTQATNGEGEANVFSKKVAAGKATPVEIEFQLDQAGVMATLHIQATSNARVEGLTLTGTQWTDVGIAAPAAPLRLAMLIHIEERTDYRSDEIEWKRPAAIVKGLSRVLHAHGLGLNIQADATFFSGVSVWEPSWVEDRLAEGATFSTHLHYVSGGDAVFRDQVLDARKTLGKFGVKVKDLNGGYSLGSWGVAAESGYCSMTALKVSDAQEGLPSNYSSPWRPPDGSSTADLSAFMEHDPSGPLIYLPGMEGREADHRRWPDWARRILSQVLSHTDKDAVNTWYFVSHVDAFGPTSDDEFNQYVDDGSFEADLANYDTFLSEVTDPMVEQGDLLYSSPDDMTEAYQAAETAAGP